MNLPRILLLFLLVLIQCNLQAAAVNINKAVVIVSGGAAVSPFTTPSNACKTGYPAGSTDSFMREYLIAKGYRVFTSPAMAGYGPVVDEAGEDAGPFGQCPKALPDSMTVNSVGDIQLAGVHLANFVKYLGRRYGVKQVDFVSHSMGGLYSRSAIKYLQQTGSKIKVRSLTTLGTPWEGAPFANRTDPNDLYSGCDGQEICKYLLDVFAASAPVIFAELTRTQVALLNEYNSGVLSKVPVTLIAGNAFTKQGGNPRVWPNDGIVDVPSALAQNVPDSVIENRRCYLYEGGTHSTWISDKAVPKLPEDAAITWNNTVGDWVATAIREARKSSYRPKREGCPLPN
jgi:triacylglycerol lipase